jgi:hypothetical protein
MGHHRGGLLAWEELGEILLDVEIQMNARSYTSVVSTSKNVSTAQRRAVANRGERFEKACKIFALV